MQLDERRLPVIRPIKARESGTTAAAGQDEIKHQVRPLHSQNY
jgi:hypothetical protein